MSAGVWLPWDLTTHPAVCRLVRAMGYEGFGIYVVCEMYLSRHSPEAWELAIDEDDSVAALARVPVEKVRQVLEAIVSAGLAEMKESSVVFTAAKEYFLKNGSDALCKGVPSGGGAGVVPGAVQTVYRDGTEVAPMCVYSNTPLSPSGETPMGNKSQNQKQHIGADLVPPSVHLLEESADLLAELGLGPLKREKIENWVERFWRVQAGMKRKLEMSDYAKRLLRSREKSVGEQILRMMWASWIMDEKNRELLESGEIELPVMCFLSQRAQDRSMGDVVRDKPNPPDIRRPLPAAQRRPGPLDGLEEIEGKVIDIDLSRIRTSAPAKEQTGSFDELLEVLEEAAPAQNGGSDAAAAPTGAR